MNLNIIFTASCLYDGENKIKENNLQLSFAENNFESNGNRRGVFKSIIHEEFAWKETDYNENDIALLTVPTKVQFSKTISPVCLPDSVMATTATIIGYDSTNGSLFHSIIPIASDQECFLSDLVFFDDYLHSKNFCAGKNGESKNSCSDYLGKFALLENIYFNY